MKVINLFILFILVTLTSCNFESGSEDASGGGLFTGHKEAEDAWAMSIPPASTYIASQHLDFAITHPYTITVTGSPRLTLDIGGSTVHATYLTGNGTKTLTFRYTVSAGDDDANGIDINSSLDLNGGTVQYSNSGVLTNTTTSIASIPSSSGVLVDTTGPTLTLITPPTPKTYYEGEQLEFIAVFNGNTISSGATRLQLDIGGSTVYAEYASGSGTPTHIYRYTVQSTDTDTDGITMTSPLTLNGGSISDAAGNNATLTFTPVPMLTTFVEGDAPYVTSINLPADNTYILGQIISFSLVFNENVDIAGGIPGIDLEIGSNTREAIYVSGTGTNTLNFQYIVVNGDEDTNGIVIDSSINLNGATIQDSGTNNARLAIAPPLTPNVLVDGSVPEVTALTVPTDANYTTGQNLDFVVQFSEDVLVTNSPRLDVALASGTIYPTYVSGSGTDTLMFRHVVGASDLDNDGIVFGANSIDLNTSGTIVSATYTSLNALLDFTPHVPADMTNIKVNETPGTQLAITTQPTNTYQNFNVTPSITVEIRDASNNLVVAATDIITLAFGTDPSAGAAVLGGTLSVAAIGGVATFSDINIDNINTGYTLTASATGLTSDTSLPFDITAAPPSQLAIMTQPSNSVAGVNIAPAIVVELRDAANNLVTTATDNVTLSFGTDASSGTATLGGTLTVAAVGGIATFNDINIDKAFTGYTLTASSGVLTPDTSSNFDITPAAKAQLGFSVEPVDTDYGVNITPAIEIEIQDAFGNKTTDTDNITLAINNNPSAGTLAGTLTLAAVNGAATFSDINIDNVGIGYTLDATVGGLTTATSAAFNITTTPTQLVITQEPTDAYNSFNIAPAITVEIRDASNNLVATATDNVTIAFGTDPSAGSATLGGTVSVAAVGGVATFNDINIDVINNGYTLDFTSGALTGATSAAFNITQAPAAQLAFIQEPTDAVAGVNIAPSITVEIQDAIGNIVNTATDNITLAFGTDASSGTATLGGTLTVAAVAGVATFNDINIDKAFTGYTLSATSGVLTAATSANFNITPAAKSQLAFSVEPTNAEFNTNITPAIEIEIQDAFGNKTTDTDAITLAINNNPGAGTLAGTLTLAAINGTATFNDINIDNVGIGYTLDATAAGLTTATSASFDIISTATQLVITQEPTDAYNNFNISPAITVELRDASNNLVNTATDNVTISFGTDPSAGSATLGGTLTVAAVAGIATFNDINIDEIQNGYTLDFSSGVMTGATSTAFNITQAPATQLAFNQEPTDAVAGVNIAPSITVEIQDANGNIVSNATDNVTLAFGTDPSGATATLGGTLTVAAVAGVATFNDINIDKAFNGYTLSASSGALTPGISAGFNITPAAKAQLAFSVEPTNADYGVNISPAIEVEIQDTFGNKTTDTDSITLAINNNPSAGTLSGTLTVAAVGGVASFNDINIDNVGVGYTLDAIAGGLTSATSASFDITATPTQLVITQEPTNTNNGFNITPALTVELRDASNNLVTGATDNVTVAFGTDPSAGSATLSGTLTVAAVGGVATFSDINIDEVNTGYTLDFSSGVLTGATSVSFDITQAPAAQLAFIQQPSNTVAGVNITPAIAVEIQDANGNIVPTATDNVTLAFGTDASSGTATLGGTLTIAAVAGVATFNDINIDKAFTAYTLQASSGVLTAATSTNFDITPAAKAQLAFSVEPVNTEYNVNISPAIEVEIQDAFGNKTADTDSITLALNSNPGASTLSGTLTVAAVNGTASFNDINLNNVATGYTLDATAGGLTTATSALFDIIAVPTQLIITQEPTNTNNGFNITPALTVELRDASNNIVTTATDNVTIAFGTDPSAGSATLGGTLTVAAVAGVATFSDINIDEVNTGYTLSFTSGALTGATSVSFDITQAPATQLAFIQEPTDAVAGVNITPAMTVELQDANGNIVPTATDNVTLAIGTDPSSGTVTLGGTLTVAAVAGVATFNDINLDKAFTGYTLSATSGALTAGTSANFNITPAAKSQLAFSVEPTNTEYSVNISPAIEVEIQDAFGNKTSDTDSITIALNNNPGASTLSGTLTVAAVNGTATFNDINLNNVATGYTIDATAGGLTTATSAAFDIIAIPTQLVITQNATDAYNSFNIAPAMTVEIRDASNNLVTNATDNVTVAFGTDASFGAGTLGGTLTVAAVGGVATFNDINIDFVANGYTLNFTSGALTSALTTTFNITQAPAAQLAFTQEPTNAVAGVNIAPAITIEIQDANGNVVPSSTDNVTIAFSTDPSAGSAILGGTLTVAASAGVATFNDINIDKAFTGYTFQATSGALTAATSVAFNITPAAKSQLAFSVQPSNADYGVNISPAIEVEIQDAFGNVTTDTDSITLAINNNPSAGTLAGTTTIAAIAGTATFNDINIDNIGIGYTLDATAGGLTTATSNSFDITATPTQLVITQEPTDAYNSTAIAPAITVELRDASNNLVSTATDSVTVAIGTDPSAGSAVLGGTLTVAAVGGIATFNDLNIDVINNGYTLVFTSGALTGATSVAFNITQAPATQLVFNQHPSDAVAGVNIAPAMTVEIQDANGNIVTTATDNITLSFQNDTSAGAATISGTTTIAAVSGVATFNDINIDKAFNGYTLKAAATGLTDGVSNSFNITPAAKAQLGFSVEPVDTAYDANIAPAVVVEIQDAFGNKTNDTDNITLAINTDPSGGSATFGGILSKAATAGEASYADLNINTIGTGYDIIATATGLTSATSASFNILAGAPTQLIITQQPSDTLDGANISPALTVELRDSLNNLSTTATNNVTVAFGTDPTGGSAALSGSLTVAAVGGIATFSDLNIDIRDTGYTLSFTSGGLTSATSDSFDIVGPAVLAFSPSADYAFGTVILGDSKDTTFLVTHSGGAATSVGETTLVAPFTFKGGSFPGTGGTCGTTITADCTLVLTYTPTAEVTSNETVTIVYDDGTGVTNVTRNVSGTGLNSTPTALNVLGPNAVITNNCVPYEIKSIDDNGNAVNVTSNEGVSLVINNGTGSFYSDSNCTTTTTTATILSGSSSTTVYFRTTTANQNLTLIFNGATLDNTSRSVTSSNEPVDIVANISSEIVTTQCTQAEVSLVDTNGVKTGASSAQLINITTSGSEIVYNDAFCTGQVTQLNFAQYEGTKTIYVKNDTIESSTISFTDDASSLTSDSANVNFVATLTWWDSNYGKRIKISLNNLDQAVTFTDIPVLVQIDSSKLDYADLLANGDDIRFTMNDHSTTLSYAIDTWNASGTSFIWVKVPTMLASSEMDIYMYYNYGSAANAENSNDVWVDYEGVWLMNKSGADYIDETGSGKTGSSSGNGIQDITGPVGNAVYFDGGTTMTVNYDLALTLGSTSTLSFWIKTNQAGDATDWRAPGITGMSGTAASQDLFFGYIKDTGVIGSSAGGGTQVESNFVVNDDTWRYVTVSRDETSGEFRYYINGVLNGNGNSDAGFKNRSFYDFGATTKAWGGGGFIYLDGAMDSIRMSNSVLNDDRIKAEYKFTTSTNMTYSAPENQ